MHRWESWFSFGLIVPKWHFTTMFGFLMPCSRDVHYTAKWTIRWPAFCAANPLWQVMMALAAMASSYPLWGLW
jgi:hypothetical protein